MNIRLRKEQKIQLDNSADVYTIMQQILLRQQRIDRNREHFWTIGLSADNSILYIELVSMGSVNRAIAEPMEVFSFALQKRAVKIILVHNHPSGSLIPGTTDKDTTDRLVQTGNIVNLPVIDHLIITEKSYYSFDESGLLDMIRASTKYVPPYILADRKVAELKEEAKQDKAIEMAKAMKQKGYSIEEIRELTGLTKQAVQRLKP